jgi:hypothetical protein
MIVAAATPFSQKYLIIMILNKNVVILIDTSVTISEDQFFNIFNSSQSLVLNFVK